MLNEIQTDKILALINESNVSIQVLKEDLLDHLCCAVESGKRKGKDFESALDQALIDLSPNGLDEIQNETLYLLNHKKMAVMKKFTYLTGFIAAMAACVGVGFKLLHLPGAAVLLSTSASILLILFLPLLIIDRYKLIIKKRLSEKLMLLMAALTVIVMCLSVIFKLLHYPGASILIFLAMILFSVGLLPFMFFKLYKNSIQKESESVAE